MQKLKSIVKKAGSIIENGIEPVEEGVHNFNNPNPDAEKLAQERAVVCSGCPENIEEPVDFLKVEDERIPELSNKMCNACGCTLAYKLRQSNTVCEKWEK